MEPTKTHGTSLSSGRGLKVPQLTSPHRNLSDGMVQKQMLPHYTVVFDSQLNQGSRPESTNNISRRLDRTRARQQCLVYCAADQPAETWINGDPSASIYALARKPRSRVQWLKFLIRRSSYYHQPSFHSQTIYHRSHCDRTIYSQEN